MFTLNVLMDDADSLLEEYKAETVTTYVEDPEAILLRTARYWSKIAVKKTKRMLARYV